MKSLGVPARDSRKLQDTGCSCLLLSTTIHAPEQPKNLQPPTATVISKKNKKGCD